MPSITITLPVNDGDYMPDPIEGKYEMTSQEFLTLGLTMNVFVHIVITGTGPRGENQSISGNADVNESEKSWEFPLVDNRVRLRHDYTYTITAQLILSTIYEDQKFSIVHCELDRIVVPAKKPHVPKKSKGG